jgi:hypothetical protein
MTVKPQDNLRTEIDTTLAASGEDKITAAELRGFLRDFIDSVMWGDADIGGGDDDDDDPEFALPLDPENTPVEGDLLALGPDLTVGRADIIDGIAANDPENGSLTYANPLVIDLGSAADQTSYQVSLTGTLVLAEVIGAAEALRAGVTCDLLVTQAGAGTYDLTGVPTGWVNIQPEQPALATGVGAVSYVVFKIIDPDAADQVVHFTVAPGADV